MQLKRDDVRVELRSPYAGSVRERIDLYVMREFGRSPAEVLTGGLVTRTFGWADEAIEAGYRTDVDGSAREGTLLSARQGLLSLIVDASAPAGSFSAARPAVEAILDSIEIAAPLGPP